MRTSHLLRILFAVFLAAFVVMAMSLPAQEPQDAQGADVTATLVWAHGLQKSGSGRDQIPPAILWLKPLQNVSVPPAMPLNGYTLLQKNKMFIPHVLVVPVGANVSFPNADPFYHNVFSLFEGKRFDLGLYEAGSARTVNFSREGVSYIFCNIHPEMSAVVIALSTPYYGVSDGRGITHVAHVPAGEYELHVWVEGQRQPALDRFTRRVHIAGSAANLGEIQVEHAGSPAHLNKFGQPYDHEARPPY